MREYKVILLGLGGVGKSSLIKRLVTGEFTEKRQLTTADEFYTLIFQSNQGPIKFNVCDTNGQEKPNEAGPMAYFGAQGGILVFDLGWPTSFNDIPSWRTNLSRFGGDIPVVIVGNKSDDPERRVRERKIVDYCNPKNRNKPRTQYFEISVKTESNLKKPFLYLARTLSGNNELEFVEEPTAGIVAP